VTPDERELPRLLLVAVADLARVIKKLNYLQIEGHILFLCWDLLSATLLTSIRF
jgi:hypothetical protein